MKLTDADELAELLSEGLDLCARARQLDAIDRRQATLDASTDGDAWLASGRFDAHVKRHNIERPDSPIEPRCITPKIWTQEQYDQDLAAWERKARSAMTRLGFAR